MDSTTMERVIDNRAKYAVKAVVQYPITIGMMVLLGHLRSLIPDIPWIADVCLLLLNCAEKKGQIVVNLYHPGAVDLLVAVLRIPEVTAVHWIGKAKEAVEMGIPRVFTSQAAVILLDPPRRMLDGWYRDDWRPADAAFSDFAMLPGIDSKQMVEKARWVDLGAMMDAALGLPGVSWSIAACHGCLRLWGYPTSGLEEVLSTVPDIHNTLLLKRAVVLAAFQGAFPTVRFRE